ncbi:hypothetical protein FHS96_003750 [Sphingomonas zeicaulis]|uniref:hypothetical protein n=1 Tax=Sphingomonas zeicaulis TaxID=1632740 RepID=UPI003D196DED
MRTIREQLIFKALVALDEIADSAHAAPVAPSFSIRFLLAFLYAAGDADRRCFDEYWKAMQDPHDGQPGTMPGYIRGTALRGCITCMIRELGLPLTPEFHASLGHARRPRVERLAIEEKERQRRARRAADEAAQDEARRLDAVRRARQSS